MDAEESLYNLHQAQRRFEQWARYAQVDPRQALARAVERDVTRRLQAMGYQVDRRGHNERFDLLVARCCQVEVKASTWHEATRGARYQANIHNRADLLIFCCANGSFHYFVIPYAELGERGNVAVWSYDPAKYDGQWAPYLENWSYLVDAVEAARQSRTYQLELW